MSFRTEKKLYPFNPLESHKTFKEYSASTPGASELQSSTLFKDYEDSHASTAEQLSGLTREQPAAEANQPAQQVPIIKFANGDSLQTRIAALAPADAEEINNLFSEALKLDNSVINAKEEFSSKTSALNSVIRENPHFDASAIASYLKEVQGEGETKMQEQQTQETTRITALFDNDPSKSRIKSLFNLDDEAFTQFRTQALEALSTKHTKEKSAITTKMNEEVTVLHKDAQNERDRINFLAVLYKDNARMRNIINEIAERKRQEGAVPPDQLSAEWSVNGVSGLATFKGITVADLPEIQTLTGRKIVQQKDKDGKTQGFSFHVPSLLNFNYHFGYHKQLKYDLFLMAMALKASGKTELTMTVTHTDEDEAMKLACLQYEAALEAGFPPEKIKIKINGKDYKGAEEIFGDRQAYLQKLIKDYKTREDEKDALIKQVPMTDVQVLKEKISAFRQEAKLAEEKHNDIDPEPPAPAAV